MKYKADPASMVGHPNIFKSQPKRQSKSFGGAVCKPKVVKFKLIAMDMGECEQYRVDRAVVDGQFDLNPNISESRTRREITST